MSALDNLWPLGGTGNFGIQKALHTYMLEEKPAWL